MGEALIGLVARDAGPLEEARTFDRHVVGAESNVAIGLARLGHRVAFVGRVGDDAIGRAVRRRLLAEEVGVDALLTDAEAATGLLLRERRGNGPSEVLYRREGSAGSRLCPDDVERAADKLATARWLVTSGVTLALTERCRAAVHAALDAAQRNGARVCIDVNHRAKLWSADDARRAIDEVLPHADLLLAGADEAELLTGLADTDGAAAELRARGARAVVIKLGARGAEAHADAGVWREPAAGPPVVRDLVGAGDGFAAGYLSALLDGARPPAALRRANACAAFAIAAVGDVTGLPRRAELARDSGLEALR
jgi:2-dehydro-3-deoxygluconokinase